MKDDQDKMSLRGVPYGDDEAHLGFALRARNDSLRREFGEMA